MADALRLFVLLLALASGLAAVTYCGFAGHQGRARLFRTLLTSVALFNVLVLFGLVFWYMRMHLPHSVGDFVVPLLSFMAVVKIVWLVSFVALVRILVYETTLRPPFIAGAIVLSLHWLVLGLGLLWGKPPIVSLAFDGIEVLVFLGAIVAATWLIRHSFRVAGDRGRALRWFGVFHLGVFVVLACALIGGWMRPDPVEAAPIGSSLIMVIYNLFPIFWLRRFFARSDGTNSSTVSHYGITGREREIIELICDGCTNQEIADRLFISLATVKDHNHNIFRKAGVRNRVEVVNLFRQTHSGGG